MTNAIVAIVSGVIASSVPVLLGLLVYNRQRAASRSDEEARRNRENLVRYLTKAYESVYAIGPAGGAGALSIDEKRGLEEAFRDAYLWGNANVVGALDAIMAWAKERSTKQHWDELISALREQLRELYRLAPVSIREGNPWIYTGWRTDSATAEFLKAASIDAMDQLLSTEQAASALGVHPSQVMEFYRSGILSTPVAIRGQLYWRAIDVLLARKNAD